MHSLPTAQAELGVVTASSGNHGIGVSTAAASRGVAATIFFRRARHDPRLIRFADFGAEIMTVDSTDSNDAENAAREYAGERSVPYVSPYNHPLIIAGRGPSAKRCLKMVAISTRLLLPLVVAV